MEFTEFSLHTNLQKGIEQAGYITCTPVQEQVLQASLDGADLYVQSQTGTGKTAAYLVSIIQQLLIKDELKGKKALILVPTRELAVQVEQEAITLCSDTELKSASFYGGVGYTKQIELLKNNIDIIVGTPGRVIDLQEQNKMDLSNVGFLVVDEADRMFDMGFYPDLRTLIKVLPKAEDRQTMLFSATLNSYVKNLAWEYTRDAKEITIEADNITVEEIDQVLLHVSSDSKMRLLLGVLKNESPESVIIFCNTKKSCEIVSKRLEINGIESQYIIGDLPQVKRLEVLRKFKEGKLTCLVATDVAARGIDVNDLSMVINYDLPNEAENYVHRIGRTARAGKSGKAYTFCSEQDVYNLIPIERYIDMSIPASVAFEDMMSDDKSKDIYIKLDSYDDDDEHSKSKGSKYKGKNGKNSNYKNSRSKGDYKKSRNYKSYKSDNNEVVIQKDFDESLANLSFEERMKKYKEKYGGSSNNYSNSSKTPGNKTAATKDSKGKKDSKSTKNTKGNNKGSNKNSVTTKTTIQNKKQTKKETKKGLNSLSLLDRIKLWFKK